MKTLSVIFAMMFVAMTISAQDWKPVEGKIVTRWTKDVDPNDPWPEYPRPQMRRAEWLNLNGLWDYKITETTEKGIPGKYDGKILVPFAIESALSGVQKTVGANKELWYRRTFELPASWMDRDVLLHFEAVDWASEVWVNDQKVGAHKGGYDPFHFDVSTLLRKGTNELVVKVTDPTDHGWQPLGKQISKPGGIFYTSVTGIWQTVWLEPVSKTRISSFNITPDIDAQVAYIKADISNKQSGDQLKITISKGGVLVGKVTLKGDAAAIVPVKNPQLWTPENPQLYDVQLQVVRSGKIIDKVDSYFGMRKVSIAKGSGGYVRLMLNNQEVFHNGPLDQGYWPDGLYTPPTEEAMIYDIKITKQLGFNMLRKHVKIESRRYYYWCDKMGIMVWQDMPNGDKKIGPQDPDIIRSKESAEQFEYELKQMIDKHYNHPSIVMWIPFNEGWGQYDTRRIVSWIKEYDPSRLVNNASGWTDRKVGDIHDIHNYPHPASPEPEENRAVVLGEFGGLGLPIKEHMWENANWGYRTLKTKEELLTRYEEFYADVWKLKDSKGLSACVYTQTTDVETETNGLMTYDREIMKLNMESARKINTGTFITAPVMKPNGGFFNQNDTLVFEAGAGLNIHYTTNGSEPTRSSSRYDGPILLKDSGPIKVKAFSADDESRTITRIFQQTEIKRPVYKTQYSKKYEAGGDFALIDGIKGGNALDEEKWQGFEGKDLDIIIDLQEEKAIKEISIRFLDDQVSWVFLPSSVTFSVSTDGSMYETLSQVHNEIHKSKRHVKLFKTSYSGKPIRYIRVFAHNIKECPEWHTSPGGKSWIFTDEIEFK
ncbi:beta-galactosidase [Puteibacter caeruleilacunae]|nr:beta-galactosidase [Puteibacter caeruleilacunae]